MCGIFGVVACAGREASLSDAQAARCRDALAHRGPDGSGLWRGPGAVLAHRRLAVVDPSETGAQPMVTPDGRCVLVYNGELYNDAEVRRALAAEGVVFRGRSDAETVLHALARWGVGAVRRFRGMFALAFWDTRERRLLLARDPLGVKPLYFFPRAHELLFASEPTAIFAHPDLSPTPNLAMVSAYLTTIRAVLGNETLFGGLHALGPGQMALCDLSGDAPAVRVADYWDSPSVEVEMTEADAARRLRAVLEESLVRHLRSDAPVCSLLSGGIDSTILAALSADRLPRLRTYCSGAAEALDDDESDFAHARRAAAALGSSHAEAPISRERFDDSWTDMVRRMGMPLSTPNEVAILAVSEHLRADGCVVALSGEGADELLGGYEAQMAAASDYIASSRMRLPGAGPTPGRFLLESNSWIETGMKRTLLAPNVAGAIEDDRALLEFYDETYERCAAGVREARDVGQNPASRDDAALEAHLRFHRRINLTGLLGRLDSATMLAGVEGRVPFADAEVGALADAIPVRFKFDADAEGESSHVLDSRRNSASAATLAPPRTKLVLRAAFADLVPPEILERTKASFPLPFQSWIGERASHISASPFARAIFRKEALDAIGANPHAPGAWRIAWPAINIALWGDRWWS